MKEKQLAGFLVLLVLVAAWSVQHRHTPSLPFLDETSSTNAVTFSERSNFLAVVATKIYGEYNHKFEASYACPWNCSIRFTHNLYKFDEADAVIFHVPDISKEEFESWIKLKRRQQLSAPYVLACRENPLQQPLLADYTFVRWFSMSMTYRLEADVPLVSSRSAFVQIPAETPLPLSYKNDLVKEGQAQVVWIGHSCDTSNRRAQYVQELMHHIKIDSYGSCLQNKDWPAEETVFDLIRKYKFMLVFEEANCNDFVTPLFWSAIQLGIVPVYMGAPNIDEFSPTDYSVIQVVDFPHPKDLAFYISYLGKDDEKYLAKLDYKFNQSRTSKRFQYYLRKFHDPDPFCRLCERLKQAQFSTAKRSVRVDQTCQDRQAINQHIATKEVVFP